MTIPRVNSLVRSTLHSGIIVKSRQSDLLVNVIYYTLCGVTQVMPKKMPLFSFPRLWNKWFDQVNSQRSRAMLKKHVKTTLLAGYQPSVKCKNTHCSQCN